MSVRKGIKVTGERALTPPPSYSPSVRNWLPIYWSRRQRGEYNLLPQVLHSMHYCSQPLLSPLMDLTVDRFINRLPQLVFWFVVFYNKKVMSIFHTQTLQIISFKLQILIWFFFHNKLSTGNWQCLSIFCPLNICQAVWGHHSAVYSLDNKNYKNML